MKRLHRSVQRFQPETRNRLDELAELASNVLNREVSRAAVVRAAVCAWLVTTKHADPRQLVEAIRTSIVPRGKKPQ